MQPSLLAGVEIHLTSKSPVGQLEVWLAVALTHFTRPGKKKSESEQAVAEHANVGSQVDTSARPFGDNQA
jgi:hypothetical protein